MFIIPFLLVGGVSVYFTVKVVKGYINSPENRLIKIKKERAKYVSDRGYERLKSKYVSDVGYERLKSKSDSKSTNKNKVYDKNIFNVDISISNTPSIVIKDDGSCNIEGVWKFKKLSSDYSEYKCVNSSGGDIGSGWIEISKIKKYFPEHKYEHSLREMLDGEDILTITSKDSYFKNK